jgi:hypothetical protein
LTVVHQHHPPLYFGNLSAGVSDDRDERVAAYREALSNPRIGPGLHNFLITADPAPVEYSQSIDPFEAERAARSLDFKLVKTVALPDGREARIWWLNRRPTAPKAETTHVGEGGRPDSKIAHSKQGTYTLDELPPPEPVSEDAGLQNVEVQDNGDLYAHPPSGAAFTIENKRRPVSVTFTPFFLSDVPVERPMASRSNFGAAKSASTRSMCFRMIPYLRLRSIYPRLQPRMCCNYPLSPGLVPPVTETMIGHFGATYGS